MSTDNQWLRLIYTALAAGPTAGATVAPANIAAGIDASADINALLSNVDGIEGLLTQIRDGGISQSQIEAAINASSDINSIINYLRLQFPNYGGTGAAALQGGGASGFVQASATRVVYSPGIFLEQLQSLSCFVSTSAVAGTRTLTFRLINGSVIAYAQQSFSVGSSINFRYFFVAGGFTDISTRVAACPGFLLGDGQLEIELLNPQAGDTLNKADCAIYTRRYINDITNLP